jgi:hypothetical protein
MKHAAVLAVAVAAIGVAVAAPMVGNFATPAAPAAKADRPVETLVQPQKGDTPMAERVATVGLLNKRNGLSRDIRMKPGQGVRIGDVVVRLKACETTADWEDDRLTGAFVQVIVKNTTGERWRQVFSGWLFKESPSLNVVEHPVYDVWAKDCTMRHAEVGPDTVTLSGEAGGSAGGTSSRRSNAKKSAAEPEASAPPTPTDTAASSNPI